MPTIPRDQAAERLARAVESASPEDLVDYYGELFPRKEKLKPSEAKAFANELATYVRTKLEPEEIVDLWNVVYPDDYNVWYNEVDDVVDYNQGEMWFAEP